MKRIFCLCLILTACGSQNFESVNAPNSNDSNLYASQAAEHQVSYRALYRTNWKSLRELPSNPQIEASIQEVIPFLFGPLTDRQIASPQRKQKISALREEARLENGVVVVPYTYEGVWLIRKSALRNEIELPIPFSLNGLRTKRWLNCTDSARDHQTWSFFWYFWDPSRSGCDHRLDQQYQEVSVQIGEETPQTVSSFPEYERMFRVKDGKKVLSMTFGFGYVEDNEKPDPFHDPDAGMIEFQKFYAAVKTVLESKGFVEEPISASDYDIWDQTHMGSRFVGTIEGVEHRVSIVAAANVDQMNLFAKSYATDHEGFFGWFGHSRVGSGFDAERFQLIMRQDPGQYSVSSDYQLVYWAGCNSYSYYTLPFFEMKARLSPLQDPQGTRNLDLISNGLPSLFAFNAMNAQVLFEALMNWQKPTSYQKIVDRLESNGSRWNIPVLVNVLGDEDNQE